MKKYELKIEQDTDPMNPRKDWDNITTMVCGHRSYDLGDKHNYKQGDFNSWDEMKEQIIKDYKVLMIKPLYLYDHSGITISTSSFGCNFDSGQVGWVFVDETKFKKGIELIVAFRDAIPEGYKSQTNPYFNTRVLASILKAKKQSLE